MALMEHLVTSSSVTLEALRVVEAAREQGLRIDLVDGDALSPGKTLHARPK